MMTRGMAWRGIAGIFTVAIAAASGPAMAAQVPAPPAGIASIPPATPAAAAANPARPESESISLDRVSGLARQALSDISDGEQEYGHLTGFSGDYEDATRGLLDTLLSEWAMAGQMGSIVENGRTDRLVRIRNLLVTELQDNQDFIEDAKRMSVDLESTTDAISFRQKQIALYGQLRKGLVRDRHLYENVLAVMRPAASASVKARAL